LSSVDTAAQRAKNEENLWDDFCGLWGVETERAQKTKRLNGEVVELTEKKEEQFKQLNRLKEIVEDIGNQPFSNRTTALG